MLQAEIQKIVKATPEKHSRMSKQVWLYPDRSKDKVFAEVQKRWATDTHVSSAVLCISLESNVLYVSLYICWPYISYDVIFKIFSVAKVVGLPLELIKLSDFQVRNTDKPKR